MFNYFRCRKLTPSQCPTNDVSFYKKQLAPVSSDNSAPEYTKNPSTQTPRDPRNRNDLPRLQSRTFERVLLSSGKGWCAVEPPKTLLIEGVVGVKSEASLLAQLEDLLQSSQLEVRRIEMSTEEQIASIEFGSGFVAWETMRKLLRINHFKRISPDEDGKCFRQLLKRHRQPAEETTPKRVKAEPQAGPGSSNHTRPLALSCNPFVPCVKISFEDYDRLGFSRRIDPKHVISSIFKGKIGSFGGVEESGSSWHIHFGREIDVIQADRILLSETFSFEGRSFFFPRWKLVKDGKSWQVPSVVEPGTKTIIESKESSKSSPEYINHLNLEMLDDLDMTQVISALPKFVKKRVVDIPEVNAEPVKELNEEIKEMEEAKEMKNEIKEIEEVKKPSKEIKEIVEVKKPSKEIKEITDAKELSDCQFSSSVEEVNSIIAVIEKEQPKIKRLNSSSTTSTPKKTRNRTKKEVEIVVEIDVEEEEPQFEEQLTSGCARSEGFFLLPSSVKQRVKFPGILEAFSTASPTATADSSRSSRAQNRRPLPSTSLDLFKVSPLQSAQKFVALRNSSIHSYGLVILEHAEPGDLIIEYVGELVRASVANIRERRYEREHHGDGIASSYLFRLDDVMVIDATKKGSLARFINHSCDPNCVAKTISLNGSNRIVMYAKKPLRPGDELTYDYKFPLEKNPEKRVKCLCGSNICRKFLN